MHLTVLVHQAQHEFAQLSEATGLLTSSQAGVCGWWHKTRARLWMRLTCSLFPHRGNRRMWGGTTVVEPSLLPSLVRGLTCGLGIHGPFKVRGNQITLGRYGLWRKTGNDIYLTLAATFFVVAENLRPNVCIELVKQQEGRKSYISPTVMLHCQIKTKVSAHVKRAGYIISVHLATTKVSNGFPHATQCHFSLQTTNEILNVGNSRPSICSALMTRGRFDRRHVKQIKSIPVTCCRPPCCPPPSVKCTIVAAGGRHRAAASL